MKIVSVCACTSGIAHTYIAKEKLIRAAESMGHQPCQSNILKLTLMID